MNNNQRFDDHIKEQFSNYTPDVQPHIWENIIDKRKKKKPVGFWFTFFNGKNLLIIAAVLLAVGSGAYFLLRDNTTKNNDTVIATDKTNKISAATATTISDADKNNISSENTNATTNTEPNTTPENNITNAVINNKDEVILNRSSNFSTTKKTVVTKTKIYAPGSQVDDDQAEGKTGKNKYKRTYPIIDPFEKDIATNEFLYNNSDLKKLNFTAENIFSDKKAVALKPRFFPNVYLPDCPSIEKNAAGNKTYIEVYGGPDIAFRNLSDTGNSAYLQKRKESTKFSSAFSTGIRYTKVFSNGMSIRTGLNYSQINEKFTLVQGNVVQVTYIINASGDTTGSYTTTGTRYKTTYNKFKTIDVPILIGYELGNGRLHANINAGVMVNIYSWQKGDVLDMSGNPVSITTGKADKPAYQFKTNIGMAFMTSASFYYKLNDKLHLLAEPYYRYNLAPMSTETLTLKQKYNTAGLRLGIRVDLHQ